MHVLPLRLPVGCAGRPAGALKHTAAAARRSAIMSAKPAVKIDVWSDFSCPWCWVGKKRMDKALALLADTADCQVEYHAYIIDHGTAPGGEEYLAYNQRRWGSDGWTSSLRRSGRPDGATFADWRWWPNSFRAHQLLLLAQQEGKGRQAKELLFEMTYEHGRNISEVDTLVEAAEKLSLPDVRQYLEQNQGRQAVLQDDTTGKRELNISGVPYFIIGGGDDNAAGRRYALSGAQPTSAFVQTINKVLAEQQSA